MEDRQNPTLIDCHVRRGGTVATGESHLIHLRRSSSAAITIISTTIYPDFSVVIHTYRSYFFAISSILRRFYIHLQRPITMFMIVDLTCAVLL
jgi:hypothetical protein